MRGKRSYEDPCGVARGLNLIGERWALLVVRELLYGPKRFTDLHAGLHSVSQNVLSQRLRELEQAGVIRRRRLGPPAGTWVYELTDWGHDLEPVLFHLARWGGRAPMTSVNELSVDALMLAMKTTFDPHAADGLRAHYELRLGEDHFSVEIADGGIEVARGAGRPGPDAVIETDAATLCALVFGERALDETLRSGDLELQGDHDIVSRFADLFPRPAPADTGTSPSRS